MGGWSDVVLSAQFVLLERAGRPLSTGRSVYKVTLGFVPTDPHKLSVVEVEVVAGGPPPADGHYLDELAHELVNDPAFIPLHDLIDAGYEAEYAIYGRSDPTKAKSLLTAAICEALDKLAAAD